MPGEYKKEIVDLLKPGAEVAGTMEVPEIAFTEVNVFELEGQLLKGLGIKHFYSLNAAAMHPHEQGLMKAGLARVQVRHEQAATFAADAEARLLGRPGMALIGPGTGITNASSGVCQAYAAQSPMFVLVGESGVLDDDIPTGQGVARAENQFYGITKWTRRVPNPNILLWNIVRGFRSCVTPPYGPVCVATPQEHFEIKWQVGPMFQFLQYYNPEVWLQKLEAGRAQANPQDVEAAMKWLMEAEKPCIVTGSMIHYEHAVEELNEFVHLTGIPCHTRRVARGAISEYDPLNCYGRARGAVMRDSDRCLVMGLRIAYLENMGYPPFWGGGTRYIQAQPCREDVCLGLATDFELIGNMKLVLRQMIDCIKSMGIKKPPERWNGWRQIVSDKKDNYRKRAIERSEKARGKMPLHPDIVGRLMAEFATEELNDEYITIIDGFTASSYWTDWNMCKRSGTVLDASETVGIGHGFGMAIGAAMATERKIPIIAVVGDGAVGAGAMDIETAVRWDIPAVFVHLNNDSVVTGWKYFRAKALRPTGDYLKDSWEVLPHTHYEKMFAEFGCHPEFVERDEQLKPALKRAMDFVRDKSKPAFVEIFIDKDVLQEVWATMLGPVCNNVLKWDELPEEGQKFAEETAHTWGPGVLQMTPPDWIEALLARGVKLSM